MSFAHKTNRSENSNAQLGWDPDAVKLTEDHHKEECNIKNKILSILRDGDLSGINDRPPQSIDLSTVPDFMQAQQLITEANSMWEQIPAKIRAQFNNDQQTFLEFMHDPKNKTAIGELGFDNSYIVDSVPQSQSTSENPAEGSSSSPKSDSTASAGEGE